MLSVLSAVLGACMCLLVPVPVFAQAAALDLTGHPLSLLSLVVFFAAYLAVVFEERLHLRKSKPMLLAAGCIWVLVSLVSSRQGLDSLDHVLGKILEEYASLLLFLLVAMTYVSMMSERRAFMALRAWLVSHGFSYRGLFWVTGILSFFLSAVADNLTTALVMGAVVLAVANSKPGFVAPALVNVVVAANAGGAFSPFGDITTLMVWQANKVEFFEFFALFVPSVVNYLVPAVLMTFFVPTGCPAAAEDRVEMLPGALAVCALFLCTVALAVVFEHWLHLPPYLGMMTGLALLMMYTWQIKWRARGQGTAQSEEYKRLYGTMDPFERVGDAEWDTLLFFFGVMFSVGALSYLGYLQLLSGVMYGELGYTWTHIAVGLVSAIVDNIPVMFSILDMSPDMGLFQWLLVTLTAGVGGSMLAVGSAAGVAMMGIAQGRYTFLSHLRWSWAVAAGYIAAIATHCLVNG